VLPKKVLIDISSNVPGLKVLVDDFEVIAPMTITAWQNQNLKLEVVDQFPYVFASWNIAGGRVTNFLVPPLSTTKPNIIANFRRQ
jgi:hypothetical protein